MSQPVSNVESDASQELCKGKLERVAAIFRAFSEPTRLGLLQALRGADSLRVSELVKRSGTTQANVSKHLKVLHDAGVLTRRRQGNLTLYSIADPIVSNLIDAVCEKLNREALAFSRIDYAL